ncbi:MAG: hypothetical protein GEV13_01010 [Rhodospirillales bacterium]|nr:hypothetical protein [Rhodospirillales bacterium]
MTVVVAVKISDGIIVSSDSASSLMNGPSVLNIYNNANKIFNLRKGLPIGAMTCGAGSVGKLSIATISKDFRAILTADPDANSATVSDLTHRYFEYLRVEHYEKCHPPGNPDNPRLNLWVFGFSPGESLPEIWEFSFGDVIIAPKETVPRNESGLAWGGEPELIQRVVLGYGATLPKNLADLGVAAPLIDQALGAQRALHPIVTDAMPVQDAIELAEFLVRSTIDFCRFKIGAPTVGGPIEVAAVTKHEGFKWVKRKHYFDQTLNPELEE